MMPFKFDPDKAHAEEVMASTPWPDGTPYVRCDGPRWIMHWTESGRTLVFLKPRDARWHAAAVCRLASEMISASIDDATGTRAAFTARHLFGATSAHTWSDSGVPRVTLTWANGLTTNCDLHRVLSIALHLNRAATAMEHQ